MRFHSIPREFCNCAALFLLLVLSSTVLAQEKYAEGLSEDHSVFHGLAEEIRDGFDYLFKGVGYGNILQPNVNIPVDRLYSGSFQLRPDFFLDFRRLRLVLRPRLAVNWEKWDSDWEIEDEPVIEDESSIEDDWYIHEWLARVGLADNLFVSYGRENLQWGPSFLFSPSNPFYKDNGRTNPLGELPGMDYARLVWIIHPAWTLSLIANLDEGRQIFLFGFEPTYALKLDFTGDRKYFSLIPSKREGDKGELGAYAGWNLTDALTLHGETSVFYGVNPEYKLYQLERSGILDVTRFEEAGLLDLPGFSGNPDVDKYQDTEIETLLLVGGSYTFGVGGTLTLEYVYNSAGWTDEQADLINEDILKALEVPPAILRSFVNLSQDFLSGAYFPELPLFRKNYLMLQYQHPRIQNVLNVLFRFTYGLDDESGRFTSIIGFDVGERTQLYFVGRKTFGPALSEFQLFYDYSLSIGLEYTF